MSETITEELPTEYDSLCIGITLYDPQTGSILDANQRAEAIFGYDLERLQQIDIVEYTADTHGSSTSEFLAQLRSATNHGHQQLRWRIQRENGELRWVQFHFAKFEVRGQTCVRAELRDVTEILETTHREELFRRVLRHNLRNEATVLMGHAERIRRNAETPLIGEAAGSIYSAAENIGSIVESVGEIEDTVNQTTTSCTPQSAAEVIRSVSTVVGSDYPEADIRINAEEKLRLPDSEALRCALRHAIENAIVHSSETEAVVKIHVKALPKTDRIRVCIADDNSPIPNCEIDAIHDRESVTTTSHGSGIGLFVMKWCVESLGGEIEIKQANLRGNKVLMYLPNIRPAAVSLTSSCDAC